MVGVDFGSFSGLFGTCGRNSLLSFRSPSVSMIERQLRNVVFVCSGRVLCDFPSVVADVVRYLGVFLIWRLFACVLTHVGFKPHVHQFLAPCVDTCCNVELRFPRPFEYEFFLARGFCISIFVFILKICGKFGISPAVWSRVSKLGCRG